MVAPFDQLINDTSSDSSQMPEIFELSNCRNKNSNTSDVNFAKLSETCSSQPDPLSDLLNMLGVEQKRNHQQSQEITELREQKKEWDKMKNICLNPISMPVFFYKDTTVRIKPGKKITFKVKYEDGLYLVEKKAYSILAFSITRDGLVSELCEQIVFLWKEFVKNTSSPLTASAEKLRQKLIADFDEI